MLKLLKNFYTKHTSDRFRYKVSLLKDFFNRCLIEKRLIREQQVRNQHLAQELRKKDKIRVLFLVELASVWKYDELYRLLSANPRFIPTIMVTPVHGQGDDYMFKTMNETYERMKGKGYAHLIKAYDEKNSTWTDVHRDLSPDIIFFSRPYHRLSKPAYAITAFPNILSCYVPYSFYDWDDKHYCDLLTHNLVWIYFAETVFHKQLIEKHAYYKGKNVCITGYPGCDPFLLKNSSNDVWKSNDRRIKRIIWAPHHSVEEGKGVSAFFKLHDLVLQLAEKYKENIQIAFKPHPLLHINLYNHKDWGRERTDAYYKRWKTSDNLLFVDGAYTDLFIGSDAMMHDSGSFVSEYMYTKNPVLYTSTNFGYYPTGEFSTKAYELHYKVKQISDVEAFIKEVVINGNDTMKEERESFFDQYLRPANGKIASENIYDNICQYI